MEETGRAAFYYQLAPLIESGQVKEFPDLKLLTVLSKQGITLQVQWRKKLKRKTKSGEKEYLREYKTLNFYPRGVLLYPWWTDASREEAEQWSSLSADELKSKKIVRQDGKFRVLKVMAIKDLSKGIRQRMRHMVRNLIGVKEKQFEIAGEGEVLAEYAEQLTRIISPLLKERKVTSQLLESSSKTFLRTWQSLEGKRSFLLKSARDEIAAAGEGKVWQIASHGGKALAFLLEERARKYEMAARSYLLGTKWLKLYEETRQKIRTAYLRLGKLIMEIEGQLHQGKVPEAKLAREIGGIYLYLSGLSGSYFDPFCERVHSSEVEALSRLPSLAENQEWEKVLGIANRAHAKLEAVAKGEVPKSSEVEAKKEFLSM